MSQELKQTQVYYFGRRILERHLAQFSETLSILESEIINTCTCILSIL